MTVPTRAYLIALSVAVFGGTAAAIADDDVTVVSSTPAAATTPKKTTDADGTPVVHKSSHKKKKTATDTASATPAVTAPAPASPTATAHATAPAPHPAAAATTPASAAPVAGSGAPPADAKVVPLMQYAATPPPKPAPPAAPSTAAPPPAASTPAPATPAVETGLPVARYPGAGVPISGVSTYQPPAHPTYYASLPIGVAASAVSSFMPPNRPPPSPLTNFNFTSTAKRYKNTYPWKTNIITTLFWIGEGSTPISSTTNVQSSWDEDWLSNNRGSDSPYDRNGYASGGHASTLNPFYCALPFNDLAFPDKARRWLPNGWYRHPEDGKQVSACKDRWVEIKNAKGDVCYAQWEDVGPLRYDHAEYVFGNERPTGLGDDHAGLDVSPAVADYLNLNDHNRTMSWRFVDAEDVRPGAWLKLDEQAVIFKALHQMKSSSPSSLPIQRQSEPLDDPSGLDSNKQKVGDKKG
jgi:hypothetical protein